MKTFQFRLDETLVPKFKSQCAIRGKPMRHIIQILMRRYIEDPAAFDLQRPLFTESPIYERDHIGVSAKAPGRRGGKRKPSLPARVG